MEENSLYLRHIRKIGVIGMVFLASVLFKILGFVFAGQVVNLKLINI